MLQRWQPGCSQHTHSSVFGWNHGSAAANCSSNEKKKLVYSFIVGIRNDDNGAQHTLNYFKLIYRVHVRGARFVGSTGNSDPVLWSYILEELYLESNDILAHSLNWKFNLFFRGAELFFLHIFQNSQENKSIGIGGINWKKNKKNKKLTRQLLLKESAKWMCFEFLIRQCIGNKNLQLLATYDRWLEILDSLQWFTVFFILFLFSERLG